MTRIEKRKEPLNAREINESVVKLKIALKTLQDASEIVADQEAEMIPVYYKKSLEAAVKRLSVFASALRDSIAEFEAGIPLELDDEVEALEAEIDRAAKRGATAKKAGGKATKTTKRKRRG